MEIKKAELKFNYMEDRTKTNMIVLHHAAATNCSVEDVHRWHKEKSWAGIGYHFLVRKDGTVWEGRPLHKVGAHAYGHNSNSIGICFEGNFENEQMPDAQKNAGKELVSYVKSKYNITSIKGHRDLMATACPGKNFPFDEIKKGVISNTTTTSKGGSTVNVTLNVLSYGSEGAQVKALQRMLHAMGYNLGVNPIDGQFGTKTQVAVRLYQQKKGLDIDGIVGEDTWGKLLGVK